MIKIPRYIYDLVGKYSPQRVNTLLAIIQVESNFDLYALGDYDWFEKYNIKFRFPMSYGLCQLHLRGAGSRYQGRPEQLLVPETNISIGASYLRECIQAFPGDSQRGISAYNQGITNARLADWQSVNYDNYVVPIVSTQAELDAGSYKLIDSPLDEIYSHLDPLYGYYLQVANDAKTSRHLSERLHESAFVMQERIAAIKNIVRQAGYKPQV